MTGRREGPVDPGGDPIESWPYDLVVVVTDVPLLASRERFVPGLASPIARVAVVSTGPLRRSGRDEPIRRLDSEPVRRNAAALLLHLVGHR